MLLHLLLMGTGIKASTYIEPVYWNVENSRFLEDYTRHVQLQQKMDIFCPRRFQNWKTDESQSLSHHYQTIYMVDEGGYQNCMVDTSTARKLMTCRTPDVEKKYTIIFQEVNPNPFGFEFEPDGVYYFISTSSGHSMDGLENDQSGVCESNHMRMKIQVHPGDEQHRVQKMDSRLDTVIFAENHAAQSQVGSRQEEMALDTEKQTTDVIVFNNFLIIGIVLGVILVLMIIVVAFLTRRSFQRRKNLSYPTLSDYQSSYVESYDYPHPVFTHQNADVMSSGPGQTMVDLKTPPPPPPQKPIIHPNTEGLKPSIIKHKKGSKEEFSYIDGRLLTRSNRSNNVIVI